MKKSVFLLQIAAVSILFSATAFADGHGGWGGHGHHHGWGHHYEVGWGGYGGHHGWGGGRQVNNYYYQQPPVNYYPPQPQYYNGGNYNGGGYYDNRSHQGLAGGVVGTVFGYELGNGHPLAAGIGAAAGSFLGNGVGWRH